MTARVGVVRFPGTNCELDVQYAVEQLGGSAELLWHGDDSTKGVDAIVVPGGFAHGDYLRTGAIARFSPIMPAIASFAASGGAVLGSCNGFQVLCESGMLPGALLRNDHLQFRCDWQWLRVESPSSCPAWLGRDERLRHGQAGRRRTRHRWHLTPGRMWPAPAPLSPSPSSMSRVLLRQSRSR